MKSCLSPRQPRSMPCAALFPIVVFVTKAFDGSPWSLIAASGMTGTLLHVDEPLDVNAPAYSTRAWSILFFAEGTMLKSIPIQSPATGAASADVNTIGFAAVPTATSAPVAGLSDVNVVTRREPFFLKRTT